MVGCTKASGSKGSSMAKVLTPPRPETAHLELGNLAASSASQNMSKRKNAQCPRTKRDKARDVHRLLRVLRPLASQYPHCANTMPLPDGWSGSWRKSHLTHDTAWCKSHPRRNSCPGIPDISGSFHAILGNSPLVFLISRIVDTNCSTVA